MNRFKPFLLWLAVGAGLIFLTGYAPRPGDPGYIPHRGDSEQVWQQSVPRLSNAQRQEWMIMRINLAAFGSSLFWRAGLERAMLQKANWIANQLNLPIRRPIYTTDIQDWQASLAQNDILMQPMPSPYPDTVFGTDIYNTNFSRLKRILAEKICLHGIIVTPPYKFSFWDGQIDDLVRLDPPESDRVDDRFAEVMRQAAVHPLLTNTTEAYQLATQYLAAVDINLDMLEKSRLPHPVRQEEDIAPGATQPRSVYYVSWGTNYYGLFWLYQFWHTNEWHPSVMVKIGPHQELLELYVGDPTYYRDPPTLIPSQTVWRLVHTLDPDYQQFTNPAVMQELLLTPQDLLRDIPTQEEITNSTKWKYEHHLLDPVTTMDYSNELKMISSELIDTNSFWRYFNTED